VKPPLRMQRRQRRLVSRFCKSVVGQFVQLCRRVVPGILWT
jgi:hypothetical protein